jgi:hypothetical protein
LVVRLLFCHLDRILLVGHDSLDSKVVRGWDLILVLRRRDALLMKRSRVLGLELLILLPPHLVLFLVLDGDVEVDRSLLQAGIQRSSL